MTTGNIAVSKVVRFAVVLTLFSLCAADVPRAHADDYYHRGGGPERIAVDNGYRDGLRHGRFDFTEHHHYNIHSQQYNDANQGYDRSMGPYKYFKQAYRDAYSRGYAEGYNPYRGEGYGGQSWR